MTDAATSPGGRLARFLDRPAGVIATLAGSLVLLVAALVAEHLCTIRKDDHDEHPGPDEPRFGLSHND